MTANKMKLKANWQDASGRVEKSWGALTGNDVLESQGDWDQLVAKIRKKTGESTEAIEDKLNGILDPYKS